jgi:[acyl-carrier-protein] S-malonyltransferase
MARALTFPGQGSHAVGMGQAVAEAFSAAREVFAEVDEALSQSLSKLMWNGPEADLTLTENAQPAIMAASLAVFRVLEREGGFGLGKHAAYVAGNSLGEYSALCAAGAFTLADCARLLKKRGQAMQKAVPVGAGGMAALIGADRPDVDKLVAAAKENDVLAIANDNAPGQIVISGSKAAVDRASAMAKEFNVRRAMPLTVSAPFHCALMKPAADVMAEALEAVTIAPPAVPVIANVTAAPVSDPASIRKLLVEQVTGMVRWRESIASLPSLDVDTVVEVGAGKVLTGMVKRISPDLKALNVDTPADIEAFLKTL